MRVEDGYLPLDSGQDDTPVYKVSLWLKQLEPPAGFALAIGGHFQLFGAIDFLDVLQWAESHVRTNKSIAICVQSGEPPLPVRLYGVDLTRDLRWRAGVISMTNALPRLKALLSDVDNLLDCHPGVGRPTKHAQPLFRSCVVLSYAAWEVYVEDALVAC